MLRQMKRNPYLMLFCGLVMGLLVGVGMLIGAVVGGRQVGAGRPAGGTSWQLPETLLHATATHGTENFAIATGPVTDDLEGLFTLDFLTGDLRCFLLNSRSVGNWSGYYGYNVATDLAVQPGKTPKFLIATGMGSFRGGGVANNLGGSVVYVLDANTGNFAVYGVPVDRNLANRGAAQGFLPLVRLGVGKARGAEAGQ
jgi:hypothetical protein